ncbi:hypothetical protein ES703_124280 [subsurface metagenome]
MLSSIPGLADASVISVQDMVGIERVDPHAARVHMTPVASYPCGGPECFSPILRNRCTDFHGIEFFVIIRVHIYPPGIAGLNLVDNSAPSDLLVLGHPCPGFPLVLRAVDDSCFFHRFQQLQGVRVDQLKNVPVQDLISSLLVLKFSDLLIDVLELGLEVFSVFIGFFRACVELLQVDLKFSKQSGIPD